MTPTVNIWMPNIDPSRGTLARSFGLVHSGVRDSILGVRNGVRTQALVRWLQHSIAGSFHGSIRVLSQFRAAVGLSFGHASIQLEDDFIGYWPPFCSGELCTPAESLLLETLGADAAALREQSKRTAEEEAMLATLDEAVEEAAELTPYEQELMVMGRKPTHTFELPGLDESAMASYWREKVLQTEFVNRTHNCCTVTQKAIEIGIQAMEKKMLFFDRITYQAKGTFRAMFHPFQTTKAVAEKVGCDILFWTPSNLYNYVQFVQNVILGRKINGGIKV